MSGQNAVELSDLSRLADDLVIVLTRLQSLIPRSTLGDQVSLPRLRVLAHLCERGPQRIKDLTEADRVSQPAVSVMVDGLAKLGWVVRQADPTDKRVVLVAATELGASKLQEHRLLRASMIADRLVNIDNATFSDISKAVTTLQALAVHLHESFRRSPPNAAPADGAGTRNDDGSKALT